MCQRIPEIEGVPFGGRSRLDDPYVAMVDRTCRVCGSITTTVAHDDDIEFPRLGSLEQRLESGTYRGLLVMGGDDDGCDRTPSALFRDDTTGIAIRGRHGDDVPGGRRNDAAPDLARMATAKAGYRSLVPSRGVLRNPVVIGLAIVLALVGGFIGWRFGSQSDTAETAETRLFVSATAVRPEALPGATAAANSLAATYARLATTQPVLAPVADDLGLPIAELVEAVTATPLPESPIVRIIARSATSDGAVDIANGVAASLLTFTRSLEERGAADIDELRSELAAANEDATRAAFTLDQAQAELGALRAQRTLSLEGRAPAPSAAAVDEAATRLLEAQLASSSAALRVDLLTKQLATRDTGSAGSLLRGLGTAVPTGPTPSLAQMGGVSGMLVGGVLALAVGLTLPGRRRFAPLPPEPPRFPDRPT
jgi:hypothetical protein